MPLPRELIRGVLKVLPTRIPFLALLPAFLLSFMLVSPQAHASGQDQPVQTSADKSLWNQKKHRVVLIGHAVVREQGETLTADRITMDLVSRTVDARGDCVYITSDSIMYGDQMHMNLDSRTGVVIGARVSSDKFTLSADRINKLSKDRFQAHWAEYSTCKDCPNSWSLEAEDVDLTLGHYAYMSNVTAKIKDAPTFWLPYLIIPVKTRRQTGLLFPRFGASTLNGFMFVLPFYWATSRSTDMTFGLGEYSARGRRDEWEGRYALSPWSGATADFYNVSDKTFVASNGQEIKRERWGLNVAQTQTLPFGIDEKLKATEVSDSFYPIDFPEDINPNGNEDLTTDLIFNYANSDVSAWVDAKRIRNLIDLNPDPVQRFTEFDPTTVQLLPSGVATTNDRFLFGTPVAAGFSMGISNFTRSAGPYDYDLHRFASGVTPSGPYVPGEDPLREATRISYTPSLYTTLRPFDVLNVVPSAHYYGYYYSFHNAASNLNRGYLLLQLDLSTQLEKIWDTPDPNRPKQKSLIRPTLTYSNIPFISEDRNHPFLEQIEYARSHGFSGYEFDDNDIVPVDESPSNQNYFIPLGNSLAYGVTTQLITRDGPEDDPMPSYEQNVDFSIGQALNFREFQKSPQDQQPFSRLYSTLNLNLGKYTSSTTYYYYPYAFPASGEWRNVFVTTQTFVLEQAIHQNVLSYNRSVSLTFAQNQVSCYTPGCGTLDLAGSLNYSLNDYILPTSYIDYSFITHSLNTAGVGIAFQSPAQCWELTTNMDYTVQTKTTAFSFNLLLNLSGSGFGSTTTTPGG